MNEVEQEFLQKGKAVNRHGIILLPKLEAIQFVKQCELHSIKILGIDGFYLKGESIQPSLDNSIDFTAAAMLHDTNIYKASLAFLSDINEKLFFEIVCE